MSEHNTTPNTSASVDHQYGVCRVSALAEKIEQLSEQHIVLTTKLQAFPTLVESVTQLKNDMQNMKTNWASIKDLVEAQALVKTTAKLLRVVGGWAAAIIAIAVVIKNLITGNWPVQ